MTMDFFNTKIKRVVALTGAFFIAISVMLPVTRVVAESTMTAEISEFMANPATATDANGEWIELMNTSASTLSLKDWDIDGSTISGSAFMRPGHSVVICRNSNSTLNDSVVCDATSGFSLNNTSDTINVRNEKNEVVASLSYVASNVQEGHSTRSDLTRENTAKYSIGNYGTPAHNQTSPLQAPGEIRVHHAIDVNQNHWPDFNAGEPHYKGRTIRLYRINNDTWDFVDTTETTGKYYAESAKFVVDPGSYALCEIAEAGYVQSFSRTITAWYGAPEVGVVNQSGSADEYDKCIPVNVSSRIITSHVFGDTPSLTPAE